MGEASAYRKMLIKILLAVCCFIPQTDELSVQFVVKHGDETTIGTSEQEIRLETSFGHAVFRADQIRGITRKEDQFTIRSAQGDSIKGKIEDQELILKTESGDKIFEFSAIDSVAVVSRATLTPGEITDGLAANEMSYHLRMPEGFAADKSYNAILILHGSNMNSKAYVNTIASAWPDIANRYILIGINGENKSRNFNPDNPAYNYSYVNFVGKSTYKGYPGTDRESPALVSEVLTELKEYVPFKKLFVGGHSQGGFLTYSVMMNYPDQVDGAFPIAGGMIFQVDPTAYDKEDLRKQQREIPLAIVHASNDRVVDFGMSESAHRAFLGDSFPMLRFVTSDTAGHSFAALPIDDAIQWLESMTTDDSDHVVSYAKELAKEENFRDVAGLLSRGNLPKLDAEQEQVFSDLRKELESKAAESSKDLLTLIEDNEDHHWVGDFYEFRNEYEFTNAAKPIVAAYEKIKEEHEEPAKKLYGEARRLFQQKKRDEAYEKCAEIVDKYYASTKFMTVKGWLDNRKDDE